MFLVLNKFIGLRGQIVCTLIGILLGVIGFFSAAESIQILGLVTFALSVWGFGSIIYVLFFYEEQTLVPVFIADAPFMNDDNNLKNHHEIALKSLAKIKALIFRGKVRATSKEAPLEDDISFYEHDLFLPDFTDKNKSKEIVKVEHDDFVKIAKPALDEDFAIGNAYMQGRGLPKDYQKAFDAFYQGAKKGSSSCACKLGIFYEHGIYKGQNELLALYWYEESAYHNNVDGYYHLAKLYSSRSAMRFKRYIYYFLEKASRAHHKEALQLRSLLINQGAYVEGLFNISKVKADCFYHYAKHPSLRDIVYKNGVFKPQDISNAYKILGIAEPLHLSDPQIARDYIRRAYYHKMHEIHPDKKQFFESDKDSKEVVEVNKSYLLLSRLIN